MTAGRASACGDAHCLTCADEGIAVRVARVAAAGLAWCVREEPREGQASPAGEGQEVDCTLVAPVEAGDLLLVHAGVALARLERAGAPDAASAGKAR